MNMESTKETLGEHSFDKCRIMVLLPKGDFSCYEFEYSESLDIIDILTEIDDEIKGMGHLAKVVFLPAVAVIMIMALQRSLITVKKEHTFSNYLQQIGIFRDATIIGYNPKGMFPKIDYCF